MLPAAHRMRRRADFTTAIQRGRRGSTRRVVVHLAAGEPADRVLVGFVVSRAVGGAVERNQVKRRLRALMADRVVRLPEGAHVVVRALPPARGAESKDLGQDLDHALSRAARTGGRR